MAIDNDTAATATLWCRFTLAVAVGVGVGAPRVPEGEKLPNSSAFQGAEILYDLFGRSSVLTSAYKFQPSSYLTSYFQSQVS